MSLVNSFPQDVSVALLNLLQGVSSPNNETRTEAEHLLNHQWLKRDNVDVLLMFLAYECVHGEDDGLRSLSAVLLRRFSIKSPSEEGYSVTSRQIDHISNEAKGEVRNLLLSGFTSSQLAKSVRHKIADAIAEVAKDPNYEWPDLVPTIMQASQSPDSSFRESAFRIISSTPDIIIGYATPDAFLDLFNNGFQDSDDDVKIASCSAFVAFFINLPKARWSLLTPLLPNLLNALPNLLEGKKDTALASVLESLIELVMMAPKMFKPMFSTIIQFCSSVVQSKDLDSSARLSALELLTVFSEYATNMCKREPTYSSTMVLLNLQLMTEVGLYDDDCAEWNNNDNLGEEDEEEEDSAARQSLDRVSLRVGGQCLAAPLFQYLPEMLQAEDWRKRQASLMALSSAVEGCRDVLIGETSRILDLILPSLNDPNPRVQYACCNALGQLSTDFSDVIQSTSGDRILPGLISMLNNQHVPRVQSHAAAALVNFCEAAEKKVLEPYIDQMFSGLLGLLQSPHRYVQEQVITTIAIVANVAEQTFIKYYDTLMPLLINVLQADMGEENMVLKGKSVECACSLAVAVGLEKFSPNAQVVLSILDNLQDNLTPDSDYLRLCLEMGWSRICSLLGKDFVIYLPKVIPPLLESGKASQDLSVVEEDNLEEINQNDEYDVFQLQGKHVAIHTAILDEKSTAINLLMHYATMLGADFYPYVNEILSQITIPGLDFYLHDGVRASSALSFAPLLKCVVEATGSPTSNEVITLWNEISGKLISQLADDPVADLIVTYYTSLKACLDVLGPNSIPEAHLDALAKSININITEIYDKMSQRDTGDDEYAEENDEDDESYTDEELLDEITTNLWNIFKNARQQFLPAFSTYLIPTIDKFIKSENTSIKLFAICAMSDVVEYTGDLSYSFKDIFMNPVGEALSSPQASLRQAAAYCVGMCAEHGGPFYLDFCLATLPMMTTMVSIPDAKADENINSTENIVASIAKICRNFSRNIPDVQELLNNWVRLLPVIHDDDAALFSYSFLVELIESNNPAVQGSQIPIVVDSVIEAMNYNSISGKLAEKVIGATKQLLNKLSQDEVMMIVNKYPDTTKEAISKWFS